MYVVCLDLEGTLAPEIWVAVAEATGIDELKLTTREEPDYDKLMKFRIKVLAEHGLTLTDIQKVIAGIQPFEGAKEFLDELRSFAQVIIVSDTFQQFAMPIMEKLGYPAIFCNTLIIDDNNMVVDYRMRCEKSKLTTINALHAMGFETIASGDSHNDIAMIKGSAAGWLFRSPDVIKAQYPDLPTVESYEELMAGIKAAAPALV